MKYSVVIPAYNASRYISEAIASVLRQKHSNWELIIINDGSKDNTLEICTEYARRETRIHIIDKCNEGVSAARNDGILAATGDYIFFLDADDMLGDNVMQEVSQKLADLDYKPDIVFGEYDRFDEHSGVKRHYQFDYGSDLSGVLGKEIWQVLFGQEPVFVSPIMAQIYRTKLLQDNSIFFDASLAFAEDHDWRFLALQHANRYYFTYFTYFYRENNAFSVTHAPMKHKRYSDENMFCIKWYKKSIEEPQLIGIRDIILSRVSEIYISSAMPIHSIQDKSERDEAWTLFKMNDYVMQYARTRRYRSVWREYRAFGVAAIKLVSWFYCRH